MKAANQPFERDPDAVDDAIQRVEKLLALRKVNAEIERIREHNEQALPATLKRQAGGV